MREKAKKERQHNCQKVSCTKQFFSIYCSIMLDMELNRKWSTFTFQFSVTIVDDAGSPLCAVYLSPRSGIAHICMFSTQLAFMNWLHSFRTLWRGLFLFECSLWQRSCYVKRIKIAILHINHNILSAFENTMIWVIWEILGLCVVKFGSAYKEDVRMTRSAGQGAQPSWDIHLSLTVVIVTSR